MFSLNGVELQASANRTKLSSLNQALDKVEPIYATLRRLQALAKQKESHCFKGLLIDYIECKPQFAGVLDIAANKKLFSVIVDDLKSA